MNPPESSSSGAPRKAHLRVVSPGASLASLSAASRARGREGSGSAPDAREVCSLDDAYRRFAPYVAAIAVRILGRSEDLDDLVQDVFVEATRGIASLADPQAIKGWLSRIAVRASVRKLRRRRLLRALHLSLDEPLDYEALASPDATPEQRALVARVYRALDGLSATDRVAWILRHVQEETLEQAAELCACSLSTYQRRLRRACAQLEKELPHE